MIRFLDLKKQYVAIEAEIQQSLNQVLQETAFVGGRFVAEFETAFASYLGAKHVVGVGNGTDALEIAIKSLELPKQGEIIVPANSFVASAEAVCNTGYKVVFCDCDRDTLSLSISDLKRCINQNSVAIMPVHLYGHPADMDEVKRLAEQHGLKIIEDAAQAHGARYKGIRVGTIGDVAAFSFYPGKNLGAYGDGGAVVTNSETVSRYARMLANHGSINKYDHNIIGRNSRLDGIQAAVLSIKLKYLDVWNEKRRMVASWYDNGLKGCGDLNWIKQACWAEPVFHLFPIMTEQRDALREYLTSHGVETGIHYPVALPKLSAFGPLELSQSNLFASQADAMLLSLPMGEHLSENDVETVTFRIREFFNSSGQIQ